MQQQQQQLTTILLIYGTLRKQKCKQASNQLAQRVQRQVNYSYTVERLWLMAKL